MRRILIPVYSVFILILLANYIYYKSLYNKQINYIIDLLDRQVQIVGLRSTARTMVLSAILTRLFIQRT